MNNSTESPKPVAVTPRSYWKRVATSEGLWFVLIVATAAHFLYSHLGFNPTDEGYMLAGSRRLLNGEIPHRDHIAIRPVGTQILHAHLLLWAGDRLVWWSRLVAWLQMAITSWLWMRMVSHSFVAFSQRWDRILAAFLCFVLNVHIFPMMPWNTIDGLQFMTMGVAILTLGPARYRWIGWVAIGMTPLFRQTFLFPLPLLLILFGEWRSLRVWLWVAMPSILYGTFVLSTGALPDAILQLTSRSYSLTNALLPSALGRSREVLIVGLLLGLLFWLLRTRRKSAMTQLAAITVLSAVMTLAIGCVWLTSRAHGWLLFAAVMAVLPLIYQEDRNRMRVALSSLIIGWGVSISQGWPTPALASGAFFLVLLAIGMSLADTTSRWPRWVRTCPIVGLCVIAAVSFHRSRTLRIYYERPASDLRYDLTGLLPGLRGIVTHETNYRFLLDFKNTLEKIRQERGERQQVVVVPELAQYWVTSPQANPLSYDWPTDYELSHPKLFERVLQDVDRALGKATYIVQKYHASELPYHLRPIQPDESAVCDRIRQRGQPFFSMEFFDVYD